VTGALVVQTSFLGDTVLTTPLLEVLAARGPVDVVVRPDAAALLRGHPAVRDVLVFDKRGRDRGPRGILRLARAVRHRADGSPRGASHAYLAQASWRSALLPWLGGVPVRIGWRTSSARALYTHTVAVADDLHFAERCWRLAQGDGRAPDAAVCPPPRLAPGPSDRAAALALVPAEAPAAGPGPGAVPRRTVVLAPGSVWGTKRWPHYPALAAALAEQHRVVVIGGADDRPLAAAILAAAPSAIDGTGRLPLLGSAAVIAAADALVANDSVAVHLASAVGTPTVALFGPTVPRFGFGPLAPGSVVVERAEVPCRPCHAHGPRTCPLRHFRCLRELAVPTVAAALASVLTAGRGGGAGA
jgi:heptosyltransferase-2